MLIKNGNVFYKGEFQPVDILCKDGKITKIGKNIPISENTDDFVYDGKDKHILPGAVDVHTHFDIDVGIAVANDDFYSGSIAAVCGGTTSIVDHMGFGPTGCSLDHQLSIYHEKADGVCVTDYGFHGVIQHVDDDVLAKMQTLIDQGISSYKIYMTYDNKLSDDKIMQVLMRAKELNIIIAVHAENDGVIQGLTTTFINAGLKSPPYHALSRPELCEAEAVNRMLCLSHMIGGASIYFVHLSTSYSLDYIDYFKKLGYTDVYTETCPQYLFLDDHLYEKEDGIKYIVSPPLRPHANNYALLDCINNSEIDVIATDHCPFSFHGDKQLGKDDFTKCPNGMPGVELRYPLLISSAITGDIDFQTLTDLCCKNPADIFGLCDKGEIAIGKDADLVMVDFSKTYTVDVNNLHENVDYTPYQDFELSGNIEMVFLRQQLMVKENQFVGKKGNGRFIKRKRKKIPNKL